MNIPFDRAVDIVDYKTLSTLANATLARRQNIKSGDTDHATCIRNLVMAIFSSVKLPESGQQPNDMSFSSARLEGLVEIVTGEPQLINETMLFKIQDTLIAQRPDLVVWIKGKSDTCMEELECLASAKILLCARRDKTADQCRQLLKNFGENF